MSTSPEQKQLRPLTTALGQTESQKSTTQKLSDTVSGTGSGTSDASKQGSDLLTQAQETATSLYNQAAEVVSSGIKSAEKALGLDEGMYTSLTIERRA